MHGYTNTLYVVYKHVAKCGYLKAKQEYRMKNDNNSYRVSHRQTRLSTICANISRIRPTFSLIHLHSLLFKAASHHSWRSHISNIKNGTEHDRPVKYCGEEYLVWCFGRMQNETKCQVKHIKRRASAALYRLKVARNEIRCVRIQQNE